MITRFLCIYDLPQMTGRLVSLLEFASEPDRCQALVGRAGEYRIPLRMMDSAGRKPGLTLSILPIQTPKAAVAA